MPDLLVVGQTVTMLPAMRVNLADRLISSSNNNLLLLR
jgi:hypothetical protein